MDISDTPKLADECQKLLDNGWTVTLFRNDLGSYTATAERGTESEITDDFLPSQALYRLTEKVGGNIVGTNRPAADGES